MKFCFYKYLERTFLYIMRHSVKYEEILLYKESKRGFTKQIMDPKFNYKDIKGYNPYFLKWGYKFPHYESVYFSQQTGVKSDLYLPVNLYNNYIFPYLNQSLWRWGYADKNMFPRLFNIEEAQKHVDVLIPEYIVYCDNGRYFKKDDTICTKPEAINAVVNFNDSFIIKPTVESAHGRGVKKISKNDINFDYISTLFDEYGSNFTIQKVIVQHPDLAAFNPTSVNTIRITTYQDPRGNVKILYAAQRFGGVGKVYDNADDPHGSGGFVGIMDDGTFIRDIHHYRNMETGRLDDKMPAKVPCYEKVKECVKFMHTRFPHFALIGWDVTVTPEGHPLIIEYNFNPGLGTGQLANGPFFEKEDLEEILEGIRQSNTVLIKKVCVIFKNKPSYWTKS